MLSLLLPITLSFSISQIYKINIPILGKSNTYLCYLIINHFHLILKPTHNQSIISHKIKYKSNRARGPVVTSLILFLILLTQMLLLTSIPLHPRWTGRSGAMNIHFSGGKQGKPPTADLKWSGYIFTKSPIGTSATVHLISSRKKISQLLHAQFHRNSQPTQTPPTWLARELIHSHHQNKAGLYRTLLANKRSHKHSPPSLTCYSSYRTHRLLDYFSTTMITDQQLEALDGDPFYRIALFGDSRNRHFQFFLDYHNYPAGFRSVYG